MNNPNFHGFGIEQHNIAHVKLGKRKATNFDSARAKTLKLQPLPAPPVDNSEPLKTANNNRWSDEARYISKLHGP